MCLTGMGAGNEGIQPLDLVDKAMLGQEIQRTIGHRRLRAEACIAQEIKDCIRPQRAVFLQEDFQHLAAHSRQTQPMLGTARFSRGQRVLDTDGMVMAFKAYGGCGVIWSRVRVACHVISYHVCGVQML